MLLTSRAFRLRSGFGRSPWPPLAAAKTPPKQGMAMLGATQSCHLTLVARLMGFEARNIGDVADG